MSVRSFRAPSGNHAVRLRRLLATATGAIVLLAAVPTGTIYVTTLPTGADVWLDGTYAGRTPMILDALPAGAHDVSITKTGWTPQDLAVSVVAGQTATSSTVLAHAAGPVHAGNGSIVLHGASPGAVWLDGQPVKPALDGIVTAPAGTHDVTVRVGGGKMTRSVTVYPEMRTDVVFREGVTTRSPVIAPADEYVPATAYRIDGARLVMKYGGHEVIARVGSTSYRIDGRAAAYDAAPTMIAARLYLPLELLTMLTQNDKK